MRTLCCGMSTPKIAAFFISVVLLCYVNRAMADVVTFDTIPGVDQAILASGQGASYTEPTNRITMTIAGGGIPVLVKNATGGSGGSVNVGLCDNLCNIGSLTTVKIKKQDGSRFSFSSLLIANVGGATTGTVEGWRAGSRVYGPVAISFATGTLVAPANWNSLDEVRLNSSDFWAKIDDFTWEAEVIPNTPPALSISNTVLRYIENTAATPVDSLATLTDNEGDANWNGGSLVVQITTNAELSDQLSIPDNAVGSINTSGTNLMNGATVIGTLSASEGTVTGGTALTISFNGNATNALVQQVARAIHYQNSSLTPGTLNRTVTFTARDNSAASTTDSRTISVIRLDRDGRLTAAAGVTEPVPLITSADTPAEAVNLFDFTLVDGGTSDSEAMTVSRVVIHVSGTTNDADRQKVTWRLNGSDASNVTGVYNPSSDEIVFSGLNISVANGSSEVYTLSGYYNNTSGLVPGNSMVLSIDGDTDVTTGSSGTSMGTTSPITNGSGTVITDGAGPVVTSVVVPANGTYRSGATLDFTVNFNENVIVNNTSGVPRLVLIMGASVRYATYLTGSGSSSLLFRHTVQAGDQDLNGIALISSINLNGSTLRDTAGNNANIALTSVGNLSLVRVDAVMPTVIVNTGKGLSEGQLNSVVSSSQLLTTDNDSTAANITYTVIQAPVNGVLRRSGSVLNAGGLFSQSDLTANRISYDHNGSETLSDGFTFTVTDQVGNINDNGAANFVFSFSITAVNDTPVALADTASTFDNTTVSIDVVANDSDADVGDSLDVTSLIVSQSPSHGVAVINAGKIDYTPGNGFIGTDVFSYTISDTNGAASNVATVTVTVASGIDSDGDTVSDAQELIDGTDPTDPDDYLDNTAPVVTVPEDIIVDAEGLFTEVSRAQLLGIAESVSQAQIQSAIAGLASDNIDGAGCCNTSIPALIDGRLLLRPGRNQVVWRAEDRKGNVSIASQFVHVRPLVSLTKTQLTVEGAQADIRFMLNGFAPVYPFSVPYVIDASSTASSNDHDLIAGVATFNKGETVATVTVNVTADSATEGDEVLIVKLDDRTSEAADLSNGFNADLYDINSGSNIQHQLTIVEGNVAPSVSLVARQGRTNTSQVTRSGGLVTVVATVNDLNTGDTVSLDWSASDNVLADSDGDQLNRTLMFDPSNLPLGRYTAELTATDSQGATGSGLVHFIVVDALPNLNPAQDSDGDGIDDVTEGTADSDGDGIPDYLDNISAANVLPASATETNAFLMECDPDVACRLGAFSAMGASGGAALSTEDIARLNELSGDNEYALQGSIYDFEIHQLATPGQQVSVVLPLSVAIPEGGVYRKFQNSEWVNFVDDDRNDIHSSQGFMGYCPPPGADGWQQGLTAGHFCLQLTIEDGGPNDVDGEVNAAISDPGAIGIANATATPTGGTGASGSTSVQSSGGGGGSFGGLFMGLLLLLAGAHRVSAFGRFASTKFGLMVTLIMGMMLVLPANRSQADGLTQHLNNSFIEFEVFSAKGSQEQSDFVGDMESAGVATEINRYDVLRTGYQASIGYTFSPYATFLLGYTDLGSVRVDFDTTTTDNDRLQQAMKKSYPLTGDGISAAYRFRHRFTPQVSVFADAGVLFWSGDVDTKGANTTPDIDGGTDLMMALGIDYAILEKSAIGLKYRYHQLDDQSLNGLGVLFRVGL
ncbi:cadherin-like domain-containing protein [Alkalimarinus coralli]|uniref:cadherin-like domain-containing protein n=1 Tax=Alkalimarinus coralli TaxID=2935863 RepID=UPI00202B80A3|nr:cadherin-like domain-containing protein [Alkalimarinus coralli]